MEFTKNCTRVPIPQWTTLYGTPVDVGPAPAFLVLCLIMLLLRHLMIVIPQIFLDGYHLIERGQLHILQSEKNIVSCKNSTIFSTFNARTLAPGGRLQELCLNADLLGIDIIAVQEHRFYHPDDTLKYHDIGSYQLVTTSASKNSVNATVFGFGIGFLL